MKDKSAESQRVESWCRSLVDKIASMGGRGIVTFRLNDEDHRHFVVCTKSKENGTAELFLALSSLIQSTPITKRRKLVRLFRKALQEMVKEEGK